MTEPSKTGLSIGSGSGKSFSQAMPAHDRTFLAGTEHQLVNSASSGTIRSRMRNPSFSYCAAHHFGHVALSRRLLPATTRNFSSPVYLPSGNPAALM